MEPPIELLLVHGDAAPWDDFIGALAAVRLKAIAVSSLAEAELRLRNQAPEIILLDSHFEHGVDLLLKARKTLAGTLLIIVGQLQGSVRLYDATIPGRWPRYLEPTTPEKLANLLCEAFRAPLPPEGPSAGLEFSERR